jgi:hypothetical protein
MNCNCNINATALIFVFATLLQIASAFTTPTTIQKQHASLFLPVVPVRTIDMKSQNLHLPSTSLELANRNDDRENVDVNVNEIGNIDAVTLTAVGFALIAFNFLVFANMGDVGIGGLVARIINTFQ